MKNVKFGILNVCICNSRGDDTRHRTESCSDI